MQRKLKKLLEGCGAEMEDNTECSHQSVSSMFSISSLRACWYVFWEASLRETRCARVPLCVPVCALCVGVGLSIGMPLWVCEADCVCVHVHVGFL